ncbi:hypothetical protein [Cupriavidus sp.]|uniref:hypothetical protein n=1 Tax=Cupriavidus sp. TaxID=1873897 RepID=UPI0028BEA02F|nr:hypothetical protein [Cupriavidus sp.]
MGVIESVQQYDLNIPAGGAQNIDVAGDRVQFLSAVDPFATVEIRPNFLQGNITLKPGQGFKFSEQVTRWVVFNRGSVPLTGYLLIGSGEFFDQRIAGTVDVIDGGKARTLGNQAFIGMGYQPPGAGFALVQLWNPVGSGKNLILEQYTVGCSSNSGIMSWVHNAPLSTAGMFGKSKLLGAPDGVGQLRQQLNAVDLGSNMGQVYVQGANGFPVKLVEPIVIRPGYGLHMRAADILAQYEWYEEQAF